jgi:hypothetical protein
MRFSQRRRVREGLNPNTRPGVRDRPGRLSRRASGVRFRRYPAIPAITPRM